MDSDGGRDDGGAHELPCRPRKGAVTVRDQVHPLRPSLRGAQYWLDFQTGMHAELTLLNLVVRYRRSCRTWVGARSRTSPCWATVRLRRSGGVPQQRSWRGCSGELPPLCVELWDRGVSRRFCKLFGVRSGPHDYGGLGGRMGCAREGLCKLCLRTTQMAYN